MGKAGRRPVRPKSGSGVPLMPVVAGVILGILTIALIVGILYLQRPQQNNTPTVAGIVSASDEETRLTIAVSASQFAAALSELIAADAAPAR